MSKTNGKRNGRKNGKAKTPSSKGEDGIERDPLGRILPGSNLNPAGARRSDAAKWRARMNAIMEEDSTDGEKMPVMDALIRKAISMALGGDVHALKLIFDRVMPATLQADISVTGLSADEALSVFICMREDYAAKGRLPDLSGRG